MLSTKLYGGAR